MLVGQAFIRNLDEVQPCTFFPRSIRVSHLNAAGGMFSGSIELYGYYMSV